MKYILIILTAISLFGSACNTQRMVEYKAFYQMLSRDDRMIADTLIKKALENEGLYTVIGGLKAMSSVTDVYLEIADKDSVVRGKRIVTDTLSEDFKKLKRYRRIVNSLQFGDLRFMMSAFDMHQKGVRTMQINVHRKSLMDSLIRANQSFYGQFGIVPGTDPQLVINTTEYEHKYNRFRSYGYLYGYPEHAVTFFVNASIESDQTKKLTKRIFFQIPVYSSKTGHFVYAAAESYKFSGIDSAIYNRATYALARYKSQRLKHVRKDGSIDYYGLLKNLIRQNER